MLREICIEPITMCELGNKLFYYQTRYSLLIQLDIEQKKFEIIHQFSIEEEMEISKILSDGNDIYLIPKKGTYIYAYAIKTKQVQRLHFRNLDVEQELFSDAYIVNGKLYCIPLKQKKIVVIDCATKEIVNEVNIATRLSLACSMTVPSMLYEQNIILNLYGESGLLIYDLKNNNVVEKELKTPRDVIYSSMGMIGVHIFLYDKCNKYIDKYEFPSCQYEESYQLDNNMSWRIMSTEQGILVDSLFSENLLLYDDTFNLLQSFNRTGKCVISYAEDGLLVGRVSCGGKFYYNSGTNCLYSIKALNIPLIDFKIHSDWKFKSKNKVYQENKGYHLKQFINDTYH